MSASKSRLRLEWSRSSFLGFPLLLLLRRPSFGTRGNLQSTQNITGIVSGMYKIHDIL